VILGFPIFLCGSRVMRLNMVTRATWTNRVMMFMIIVRPNGVIKMITVRPNGVIKMITVRPSGVIKMIIVRPSGVIKVIGFMQT
jgi:hypothetical protein